MLHFTINGSSLIMTGKLSFNLRITRKQVQGTRNDYDS